MANKTTGELTEGTTPDGTELVHAVQGGNSRKFTLANLLGWWLRDEDAMTSNDATRPPSQQSVKAYVDGRGLWENLGAVSVTGQSAITKGSLGSFKMIRITGRLKPDSDGQPILLQTSTDGGSSYATSSGDYAVQSIRGNGATVDGVGNATTAGMFLAATSVGNAANEKMSFCVVLTDFNQAAYCDLTGTANTVNTSGALFAETLAAIRLSTTARNTLRIIAASGNISGEVQFEGIRS